MTVVFGFFLVVRSAFSSFWISWGSSVRFQTFRAVRFPNRPCVCIIHRPPIASGSRLPLRSVRVRCAEGAYFGGPTRVPLSDPQAAILVQLVSHAGEVVSKHTLATAAWRDSAVTDNSLDQAISRLRKTLGSGQDGRRYIETVPNRGDRCAAVIERAPRHDPDASIDAQLAPFRAFVQGQADLDTLDRGAILRARRAFEDVLHAAPDYAAAHVGLANACGL